MSETTLKKKNEGTDSFPGWYVEFQAAVLRQLPRPSQIDKELAIHWTKKQDNLGRSLYAGLVTVQNLRRYPGMRVGPLRLVEPDLRIFTDKVSSIAKAKEVFALGTDPEFEVKRGCEDATTTMFLDVYEVVESIMFESVFHLFTKRQRKFFVSQTHIIHLCRNNQSLLREGSAGNYFLIYSGTIPKVVRVLKNKGYLKAELLSLTDLYLEKKNSPRIFLP